MGKLHILKTVLAVSFGFLSALSLKAQDIATDNEGNAIFTLPSTELLKPKFAFKNIGVNLTVLQFNRRLYYITDNNGNRKDIMAKSTIVNLEGNLVDNSDDILTIDKKTDIAPKFKIGIARGFDNLINPGSRSLYYTFAASVSGKFQHFNVYDTVAKEFGNKLKRFSPGVELNATVFHYTTFAVSLSLSYDRSIVADDLTSYQKKTNTFYVDNNIAANGAKDGYLLPVAPGNNIRFSISFPQFWITGGNPNLPLVLIPYYFVNSGSSDPNHNAGIILSVLSNQFHLFDKMGGNNYKFDQAFSIGYNFMSTGNKDPRYFFITGTFSIGSTSAKSSKSPKALN